MLIVTDPLKLFCLEIGPKYFACNLDDLRSTCQKPYPELGFKPASVMQFF